MDGFSDYVEVIFGNSCGVSDDGCQMWSFTELGDTVELEIDVVCGVQHCAGWCIVSHFWSCECMCCMHFIEVEVISEGN